MAKKVSNGKRLDSLIVVKDQQLCQGFRLDNEIALAARSNAHSVVFSGFVPFKKFGTILENTRLFIFEEEHGVCFDAYSTNLQKEVASHKGSTVLVHRYPEKAAADFDSLFARTRSILAKALRDMYAQLDAQQ